MGFADDNRNLETLFELRARGDAHAMNLFNQIKKKRIVQWVQCDSMANYMQMDSRLDGFNSSSDLFLFFTLPKTHINWDLIEAVGTTPIEETLTELWKHGRRLYHVRKGGEHSILGGKFKSRLQDLGL